MQELFYTAVLLAAAQGAVLSVVLAKRNTNHLANRILAALVGALTLMLVLGLVDSTWGREGHPHLLGLSAPLPFLFGPLLFLYVATLTEPLEALKPRSLVHAMPFAANVLFMTLVFYAKSGGEKQQIIERVLNGEVSTAVSLMEAAMVVQAMAYMVACAVLLRGYRHRIRDFFSDVHQIDLRWLWVLVLCNVGAWAIVASTFVLQLGSADRQIVEGLRAAIQLASALVVFVIGYMALWQPELFEAARSAQSVDAPPDEPQALVETQINEHQLNEHQLNEQQINEHQVAQQTPHSLPESQTKTPPAGKSAKYQRNRLDTSDAEEIAADLSELIKSKERYRDADLTLQVLADEVGVPTHTLSQVLNVHIGQSFYRYINGLRVQALKLALADPDRHREGVLNLALEAGFSSKSTTNSVFKKLTGVTPSQFRTRSLDEILL